MPLPIQAVQGFLQRNPAYLQGRDPQQVMAMLMAGDSLPMETPPVTVSPGTPAPVQPGVQIDAPAPVAAPVADYRNQDALRQNMSPAEDIIRRARESAAQRVQQAEAGAEVPAEIAEVLRRREARAEGDLETSEKERKQAMWLAVAMAGAKMASSQSPYFMSALAEGLDAGLQGFSKAKAEAAERKAIILERQDQAVLDRYRALEDAKARALAKMQAGEKLAADEMSLVNSTEDQLHERAKRPLELREAAAKAKGAEFEVETQEERFALDKRAVEARIAQGWAQIAASRERGSGGGGGKDNSAYLRVSEAQGYFGQADQFMKLAAQETDETRRDAAVRAANRYAELGRKAMAGEPTARSAAPAAARAAAVPPQIYGTPPPGAVRPKGQ
jgi:hypothetical protein